MWQLKVFVADILPRKVDLQNMKFRMAELENLVYTYWWVLILKKIQKRNTPDYKTYIGKWKLKEIKYEMEMEGADVLILWNILKPYQIYNINEELRDIKAVAWDRIDLILKIFEKSAKSIEARLQIELAAIKHMWPRIFGMGMELSRQWGGIWTKGIWETNTEIMKRHLRKKEFAIRKKLKEYQKTRAVHRSARKKKNLDTVGIVGYTNAGKSSLLNSLTNKKVLAEDKLFATLGTSVWKMFVFTDSEKWIGKEILLSDTIWFIQDLPPSLIDAFSSTLEDSIESKLLLHVIDAGDPKIEEKIIVVDDILKSIKANQKKIYVFNKIDLLDKKQISKLKNKFQDLNPIFISANSKIWLEKLKKRILDEITHL